MKIEKYVSLLLDLMLFSLVLTNLTFASNQQNVSVPSNGTIVYPASYPLKKALICFGIDYVFSHDGSGDWHTDQATWAAKFDMVVCGSTVTNVATVKALNPNTIILGYKDLIGMKEDMSDWAVVNQHEDWFMHDIYGNRLQTDPVSSWGWWLMDISNPGYREHIVNYCKNFVTTRNFDGVFCDDPWLGVWKNWFTWKYPANTIPDPPNWANDMKNLLTLLKQQIGSKLLTVNSDAQELPYSDGIWMENFVASNYNGYTPLTWVNALYQNSASGKIVTAFCHYPMDMTYDDFRFAFGCYLLGINGPNTFFNWVDIWAPSHGYYPEMDIVPGVPLGAYQVQNGFYVRDFTNLRVVVDMTARTSQLLPRS